MQLDFVLPEGCRNEFECFFLYGIKYHFFSTLLLLFLFPSNVAFPLELITVLYLWWKSATIFDRKMGEGAGGGMKLVASFFMSLGNVGVLDLWNMIFRGGVVLPIFLHNSVTNFLLCGSIFLCLRVCRNLFGAFPSRETWFNIGDKIVRRWNNEDFLSMYHLHAKLRKILQRKWVHIDWIGFQIEDALARELDCFLVIGVPCSFGFSCLVKWWTSFVIKQQIIGIVYLATVYQILDSFHVSWIPRSSENKVRCVARACLNLFGIAGMMWLYARYLSYFEIYDAVFHFISAVVMYSGVRILHIVGVERIMDVLQKTNKSNTQF